MARSIAIGTAWVRQRARAGDGAADAGLLRLEGAADLRRRLCVATEAVLGPPRLTDGPGGNGRSAGAAAAPRQVVYAGGSRYVAGDGGWSHVAGEIAGPRRPSDPLWLLDALAFAVGCADMGWGEVGCRLDLSDADEIDRSAIMREPRWRTAVRSRASRRRGAWVSRVPCVVAIGEDGTIASMAFAALPSGDGGALLWATTEFVEYGVPVEVPDLLARCPAVG